MAKNIWRGRAPAVAEVQRSAIVDTWANNDTAIFTINQKDVLCTNVAGANTKGDILDEFVVTLEASTIPEFAEVAWANYANTHLQGTAETAGKPWIGTVACTTGGDGSIGGFGITTANSGPHCANTADNWSLHAAPSNTDDIVFEHGNVDCKYNLDVAGIKPGSFKQFQSYTGEIGLPRTNIDAGTGLSSYVEYRNPALKMGPTTVDLGLGEGNGSGRTILNFGADDAAITIHNSGQRKETGIPAVLLLGTNTSNVLTVMKGDVGVAFFGGETTSLEGGVKVGYTTSVLGDSRVVLGSGVTVGQVDQVGGKLDLDLTTAAVTTVNLDDGEMTLRGDTNGITALTVRDGELIDLGGSGAIATLNLTGKYNHRQSQVARTITNVELYKGAKYLDPHGVVTETNDFDLNYCKLSDVEIEKPANKTVAFSAI